MGDDRLLKSGASAMVAMVLMCWGGPAAAVPPPPPRMAQTVKLPVDQCRLILDGEVRAYSQPVYEFDVNEPTVLRILAAKADPALLIDLEGGNDAEPRPVVAGVGLAGGDVLIAVLAAGHYRLRVLMTGDAARMGRTIAFRISLSRPMESGAPECHDRADR